MSSKNNEPAFQPFCKGNRVRHKSGIVGTVEACERRVVSGSTRWVVDLQPDDGGKVCPIWAKNCQLVSDGPVWPKFFESTESRGPEYRRRFNAPISYAVWCDGVGVPDQTYEQAIKAVAEGALVEVDENGVEIVKQMNDAELREFGRSTMPFGVHLGKRIDNVPIDPPSETIEYEDRIEFDSPIFGKKTLKFYK